MFVKKLIIYLRTMQINKQLYLNRGGNKFWEHTRKHEILQSSELNGTTRKAKENPIET